MKPEIIIVDDEEIVLMLIKRLVVRAGLHNAPHLFSNGMDAIAFLHDQNKNDQVFLVFLDINMPGFDGWEFLDSLAISDIRNQVSVVIITSSVNQSDKIKAKSYSQVIGYIEKPVTEEMMQSVTRINKVAEYFQ
ncbi:response regulator [Mongoliibacter ruber]|uniref:CheY-like chemotaxis protein n=1 Tax=Mongoliibacter ruber TaxID=1750599 RepID=A0A2T0WK87_9BACT|nr:response regulator [Mongoliibacter ruber]PRY87120.1 CheY-like chemotaxis protein [Mongoliibacter ruber]